MVKDSLFLQALKAQNQHRPPVWLMRQAGRYLASYRKVRKDHTLSEMFHHEELIKHITALPVHELGVDAAIVFSDILLPLEALGYSIDYEQGPRVTFQDGALQGETSLKTLLSQQQKIPMEKQFAFLVHAIQDLKKILHVPLIGFAGAPFTMATYIFETQAHHLLKKTKTYLYQETQALFQLLDTLSDVVIAYLKIQIDAGVDAVQIFDSWAGVLDQEYFCRCSIHYLRKILKALEPTGIPIILFCRGSSLFVEELVTLRPSAISFDWHRPIQELKNKVPYPIALQGNLDPDLLRAPLEVIKQKTEEMLLAMRGETRFIANIGHGVMPDISEDAVKCFVDTVQKFRPF